MDLQYLTDSEGIPTAVVIPIEEWNHLRAKYTDIQTLDKPTKKATQKKPSEFRGTISKKTTEELLQYTENARIEWESRIL